MTAFTLQVQIKTIFKLSNYLLDTFRSEALFCLSAWTKMTCVSKMSFSNINLFHCIHCYLRRVWCLFKESTLPWGRTVMVVERKEGVQIYQPLSTEGGTQRSFDMEKAEKMPAGRTWRKGFDECRILLRVCSSECNELSPQKQISAWPPAVNCLYIQAVFICFLINFPFLYQKPRT